ncbi:MAG: repressor LexA [Planctomycetaceae bacterium]|nr:repressor LexA [Planctomycetaceae bacterium]
MPQVALTKRQLQILDFYRAYIAENGISPTLEEVAQNFGVNKVTIFGHVAELERKGVLVRSAKGVSRGMLIADRSEPGEASSASSVTILGRIAAGAPIETIEAPETLELGDLIPKDRDVYALRVAGNSMIEDGIHDGDIVLIERRTSARDGEMVVAVLPDEEATLKRIYREPGGFRLQPANKDLSPIHVTSVEVRGAVIGVIRRF